MLNYVIGHNWVDINGIRRCLRCWNDILITSKGLFGGKLAWLLNKPQIGTTGWLGELIKKLLGFNCHLPLLLSTDFVICIIQTWNVVWRYDSNELMYSLLFNLTRPSPKVQLSCVGGVGFLICSGQYSMYQKRFIEGTMAYSQHGYGFLSRTNAGPLGLIQQITSWIGEIFEERCERFSCRKVST